MLTLDTSIISQRTQTLDAAANDLKSFFVGIDATIDELIEAIRIWYVLPEALTRPVIVNLWGMTGVGKTDLVRRLVRTLEVQDRFIEVELSNGDSTGRYTSVGSVLNSNALNDEGTKIILFDEIQRFSTLDSDGKPLANTKFSDFWELLSDGRLSKRNREDLDFLLADMIHAEHQSNRSKSRKQDKDNDTAEEIEMLAMYEIQNIKEAAGMDEPLGEIIKMPRSELIRRLEQARVAKRIYEPVDHSRTLIIISGNLDGAFSMALRTSEADVDADIFSAFTEKVSIVDVKEALSSRFKPEQVARFGNIHLIYRSLRRADFEELISREVDRVAAKVKALLGIDVTVTDQVRQLIYRNGVFPVQGVRPVFSSISDILESNLSRYVLEEVVGRDSCVGVGAGSIAVDYNTERQCFIATLSGGRVVETPFVGRLDRARQTNLADVVANVSVHEAGHAVAYAVLFGLAPLQLVSRVASTSAAGFTFPHDIHETRSSLLAKIRVFLAGGIAEEIVFGDAHASTGRRSDRERATALAMDFVRRYSFDSEFSANYTLTDEHAMDMAATDTDVEKMVARLEGETRELLKTSEPLLLDIAAALQAEGRLDADHVADIAREHGLDVIVQAEGHLHVADYDHVLGEQRAKVSAKLSTKQTAKQKSKYGVKGRAKA